MCSFQKFPLQTINYLNILNSIFLTNHFYYLPQKCTFSPRFSTKFNIQFRDYFNQFQCQAYHIYQMSSQYPNKGRKVIKRIDGDEDYVMYTETNRRRKFTKKYVAAGPWTTKENEIYLKFLQGNKNLFESEFSRRSFKVFQKMSKLLRRRDPEQCRSHHQKLILRCNGDFYKITELLKVKLVKSKQKQYQTQMEYQDQRQKQKIIQKAGKQVSTGNEMTNDAQDQHKIIKKANGEITIFINLEIISCL